VSTVLQKTDGKVRLEVAFTELPGGTIEQLRIRHGHSRTTNKTTYPPASYAPLSIAQKLQELVNTAIGEGYALATAHVTADDSYTFTFELDATLDDHLSVVAEAFGCVIDVDEVTRVTTLRGTEFVIGTMKPAIRVTGSVPVSGDAASSAVLLHHVALAECLSETVNLFTGNGEQINSREFLVKAHRAGKLAPDDLEAVYRFGVLRRPVEINGQDHVGQFSVGF